MQSFSFYEVAALLQVSAKTAKTYFKLDKVLEKDQILQADLESRTGENVEELIKRRSEVWKSQKQFATLLRDEAAVTSLKWPKPLKIYERLLSPEIQTRVMQSWQRHHRHRFGMKSLIAQTEEIGISIDLG